MTNPCRWEECEKKFGRIEELAIHLSEHATNLHPVCKWQGCGKSFGDKAKIDTLFHHMLHEHTTVRPYRCSQCFKTFLATNVLENHIKVIHRKKVETCMCPIRDCTYCEISLSDLQSHCFVAHGADGIMAFNSTLFSNKIRNVLPNHRIPTAFVQQSLGDLLQLERRLFATGDQDNLESLYSRLSIKLHEIAMELAAKLKESTIMEVSPKKLVDSGPELMNPPENKPDIIFCDVESNSAKDLGKRSVNNTEDARKSSVLTVSRPTPECNVTKKKKNVKIEVIVLDDDTTENSYVKSNVDPAPSRIDEQLQKQSGISALQEPQYCGFGQSDIDLRSLKSETLNTDFVESPIESLAGSPNRTTIDVNPKSWNSAPGRTESFRGYGRSVSGSNNVPQSPIKQVAHSGESEHIQKSNNPNVLESRPQMKTQTATSALPAHSPGSTSTDRGRYRPRFLSPISTVGEGRSVYLPTVVNHRPIVIKTEPKDAEPVVNNSGTRKFLPADASFDMEDGELSGSTIRHEPPLGFRRTSVGSRLSSISSDSDPRPRRYRSSSSSNSSSTSRTSSSSSSRRSDPLDHGHSRKRKRRTSGSSGNSQPYGNSDGRKRSDKLVSTLRHPPSFLNAYSFQKSLLPTESPSSKATPSSSKKTPKKSHKSKKKSRSKKKSKNRSHSSSTRSASRPGSSSSFHEATSKRDKATSSKPAPYEGFRHLPGPSELFTNTMQDLVRLGVVNEKTVNLIEHAPVRPKQDQFSHIPRDSSIFLMESKHFKTKTKLGNHCRNCFGPNRIYYVNFYDKKGFIISFFNPEDAKKFMERYKNPKSVVSTFGPLTYLCWYSKVEGHVGKE